MPRKNKAHRRSRKSAITLQGEYQSPNETPPTPGSLAAAAVIPPYRSLMPQRFTFRFSLGNGVGLTTAWTTTMLLDMYCIAVGGSASPVRLFNNMRIIGIKLWGPAGSEIDAAFPIILEFSPSTTAGFGGAPRTPYTTSTISTSKMAHLAVKPRKRELASQWFSAQQANYALWNLQASNDTVIQIDFVATFVNGETPVACAYSSSVAKGTIGVTNFGIAGCRAIGFENLVNP